MYIKSLQLTILESFLNKVEFQDLSQGHVEKVASNILAAFGKEAWRFLKSAEYFRTNFKLMDFDVGSQEGEPKTIEMISKLLRQKLVPHEVRIVSYNPGLFLLKLQEAKKDNPKSFESYSTKIVSSLEEIDAMILAPKLDSVDLEQLTRLFELGYDKNDIQQIVDNGFAEAVIDWTVYKKNRPFDADAFKEIYDFAVLEEFSMQDLQLFLAFGPGFDMNELYDEFPYEKTNFWMRYVIRDDEFRKKSVFFEDDQAFYGSWMHRGALIGADGIKTKNWSFHQLLAVIARMRQDMAADIIHDTGLSDLFGWLRGISYQTTLCIEYGDVLQLAETRSKSPFLRFRDWKDGKPQKIGTLGIINNRRIPLSEVDLSEKILMHTEPSHIPKILIHAATLYDEALKINDQEQLHEKLGEIFWWICKAKPWERGDPSIAEMLIKSVYLSKGFEPSSWKEGVVPWVEVELEPDVEKFSKNFQNFILFRHDLTK
jgi:hypothetical protein